VVRSRLALGPSSSCLYSAECVELDFSHLAAYHIASVRLSTKALPTFCGSLSGNDAQKVLLQRTCSCWKVHSQKRGKGPQTLSNMVGGGRSLDQRLYGIGERIISIPFAHKWLKSSVERLSGKSLEGCNRAFFGSAKRPKWCPRAPFRRLVGPRNGA
jgi:hypothetical protein